MRRGYREIAAVLRAEFGGAWEPGRQLPSNAELCSRFGSTPVTVQRAMELLADQGFIVTRPTVGSYLAERPPGTCQVGLVFPGEPEAVPHEWSWTRLSEAFRLAAQRVQGDIGFKEYAAIQNGHRNQGLRRLCDDVADGALAGLVYTWSPHELKETALIKRAPVPAVHLNRGFEPARLALHYSSERLLEIMARRAHAAGCRRPAVLTTDHSDPDEALAVLIEVFGQAPLPVRVQALNPFRRQWLTHLLAAVLHEEDGARPDTLLITDDHLVGPAMSGLADLGIRVPDDLLVVGEWNFPLPYAGPAPIHRVGFDAVGWLRQAAAMLIEAADPEARRIERYPLHECPPGQTTPIPIRGV